MGREQEVTDLLDVRLCRQWAATFDSARTEPRPQVQGIHFCLAVREPLTSELGEDGHPRRNADTDDFLPPIPLPRRMWAGSKIAFDRPFELADWIERVSRIVSVKEKDGASGRLVFVEIDHRIQAEGALAIEERQTLVYREAAPADSPLSPPQTDADGFNPDGWDAHRMVVPDERLLFRYSALTFNSHRIHYDAPYARDVERYRGLVVHGPLTASLLLQLAAAQFGENRLASFAFRGLSPAIAGETLHLVMRGAGDSLEMGAFAGDGRQVVTAEARLA